MEMLLQRYFQAVLESMGNYYFFVPDVMVNLSAILKSTLASSVTPAPTLTNTWKSTMPVPPNKETLGELPPKSCLPGF